MISKKFITAGLIALAAVHDANSASFFGRFSAQAYKTWSALRARPQSQRFMFAAIAGTAGLGETIRQHTSSPSTPIVNEKLHLHEDERNASEQYNLPQDSDKQFSKFELSSKDIDRHSSAVITREAQLRVFSQSWIDKMLFPRALQTTDPVADLQITEDMITIQPRKGLVGFVTTQHPQLGVGGKIDDYEPTNGIPETAVARQYTFDFYPHGHCIKIGRPTYGKRAGSVILTLNSQRKRNSPFVEFNQRAVHTDSKGTKTTQTTHISYPSYAQCAHSTSTSSISAFRKCLRTPIVFEVDKIEKS
jgi:hypothetical protein